MTIDLSRLREWVINSTSDPEKLDLLIKARKVLPDALFLPYGLTLVNDRLTSVQKGKADIIASLDTGGDSLIALQNRAAELMAPYTKKTKTPSFVSEYGRLQPDARGMADTDRVRVREERPIRRTIDVSQRYMPSTPKRAALRKTEIIDTSAILPTVSVPAVPPAPQKPAAVQPTPKRGLHASSSDKPFHADATYDFGWFVVEEDTKRGMNMYRARGLHKFVSPRAFKLAQYLLTQTDFKKRDVIAQACFGSSVNTASVYTSKAKADLEEILLIAIAESDNPAQKMPLLSENKRGMMLVKKGDSFPEPALAVPGVPVAKPSRAPKKSYPQRKPLLTDFHADAVEDFGWFAIETDNARQISKYRVKGKNRLLSPNAVALMRYLVSQTDFVSREQAGTACFTPVLNTALAYVKDAYGELRIVLDDAVAESGQPDMKNPLISERGLGLFLKKKGDPLDFGDFQLKPINVGPYVAAFIGTEVTLTERQVKYLQQAHAHRGHWRSSTTLAAEIYGDAAPGRGAVYRDFHTVRDRMAAALGEDLVNQIWHIEAASICMSAPAAPLPASPAQVAEERKLASKDTTITTIFNAAAENLEAHEFAILSAVALRMPAHPETATTIARQLRLLPEDVVTIYANACRNVLRYLPEELDARRQVEAWQANRPSIS